MRSRSARRRGAAALAVVAGLMVLVGCGGDEGSASGGDSGAFYADRDLEIIVPYSTGGGTDLIARYISPFLTEHVAGNPEIEIANIGGGGSIIGANTYVEQREPNGESALLIGVSTGVSYLVGQQEVKYDFSTMQPIVGFPASLIVYARSDSGVKSVADLAQASEPLKIGGRAPQAADALVQLAFEILKVRDKVTPVFGYESGGDQRLAFEQGDTQLDYQGSQSFLSGSQPLVDEGKANILFSLGIVSPEGELIRDPAAPNTPTVGEVYEEMYGEPPSGQAWESLRTLLGFSTRFGFGVLLHEDAPPEAVDALRQGMVEATKDPEFQANAEENLGPYEPIVGEDAVALGEYLGNLDQADLQWFRQWLVDEFNVQGLEVG